MSSIKQTDAQTDGQAAVERETTPTGVGASSRQVEQRHRPRGANERKTANERCDGFVVDGGGGGGVMRGIVITSSIYSCCCCCCCCCC